MWLPQLDPIKMVTSHSMMAMALSASHLTTPCVHPMTDRLAEKSRLPQGVNSPLSLLLIQASKLSAHSLFHRAGPDILPSAHTCPCHFLCFRSLQHTSLLQLDSGPLFPLHGSSSWFPQQVLYLILRNSTCIFINFSISLASETVF